MRNLLTALLGAALCVCVLPLASAQEKKPDAEAQFKKIDKNGDQKLSMQEFIDGRPSEQTEKQATESFKKADVNKDESLSLKEFKTTLEKDPQKKEPEFSRNSG